MSDLQNWAFPEHLQPAPGDLDGALGEVLDAVVTVRSEIPDDAFTAPLLGTERVGNGVVIRDDGLVLTIGYLVTEAQTVWLTSNAGTVVAAHPMAYDQVSGFGLVQALGPLGASVLARGTCASCRPGDELLVIGQGGRAHALKARLTGKREFAGYWEYVLDEALFTAPAHPQWGGAAVVGRDGTLLGIGSLLIQEEIDGEQIEGNMAVPVDLLEPILDDLLSTGRTRARPRPWLGLYTVESGEHLVVGGVAGGGPAERAGVQQGDRVLEVAGRRVDSLADLFRSVWRIGPAGVGVPITLLREGRTLHVELASVDRYDLLKKPALH